MKKYWTLFRQALHGAEHDYTEGSVGRAVILLGIPMVLEMVMESVFAVTDIFFAGRLGPNAIATIGLTESLLTIVYTVAFGLSMGAMAMMARRVGEKDQEGASNTAVQVIALGVIVSVLLAVLGVTLAPTLLRLMGATPEVTAYATRYARIMFGGNICILLLFLGNSVFRGAGDGAIAMRALWIANGLNLVLAPTFIFGFGPIPAMGVAGAAMATTTSRGIGTLYTLSHLWRGIGRVKVHRRHLVLHPEVMWRMIRLSASGTLQVFIGTASWIGLVRIVSTFGAAAVAGYTVGMRLILFAIFPAFGLGNAAATMVGQNLGAGKPDRAEAAVWTAGRYNLYFLGTMGVFFVAFAPVIIGWFTTDPEVFAYASRALRTIACGFLFYAYGMVISQSFNGAGDTWTPTWINFFCFWLFEIPMAYVLARPLGFGPFGVFLAVTLGFSSLAVVSAVIFRRGRWKNKAV